MSGPLPLPFSLAISVVVHHPQREWLLRTVVSLCASLAHARDAGVLGDVQLAFVDNGTHVSMPDFEPTVRSECTSLFPYAAVTVLSGHGNIGYGAANNLAARSLPPTDFLLVLNPDVEMDIGALAEAITFMARERACVMVTPVATSPNGDPQYLVKNYPRVSVLAMRGFAPARLKRALQRRLDEYDRADRPHDSPVTDAHIVSGCFMMMRRNAYDRSGGFDARFFLYFEDFDLSLRMSECGAIVRLPSCKIVHAGGQASQKGVKHILLFARSALRFFGKHGWRW